MKKEKQNGRRERAEVRCAKRKELKPEEQTNALDHRLGKCMGAKKERSRLSSNA